MFFTACTKEADSPILVTDITLDHATLSITEGETATLKATLTPDDAAIKDITWMSCEPTVATVSSEGVVTAIKAGETTITAVTTSGGKHASCVVTVKPAVVNVTGITLDKTELPLLIGTKAALVATVVPNNATDPSYTWSTSNDKVATVSEQGEVTAVAGGSAVITVTTTDGAKTATCVVTVSYYSTLNRGWVSKDATDGVTVIFEESTATPGADGTISITYAYENISNTWSGTYTYSVEEGKGTIAINPGNYIMPGTIECNADGTLTVDVPDLSYVGVGVITLVPVENK